MTTIHHSLTHLDGQLTRWLAPHQARLTALSQNLLRISLGLVFLLFGLLKFVPGLSPAQDIAVRTLTELSFGLIPGGMALALVALMETTIGLTLLTGRYLKLGLVLLGGALVGILSPLVLFPSELFAGPLFAPTLMGQYVIKDIVLLAAALVIAVHAFAQQPATRPATAPRLPAAPPQAVPESESESESELDQRRPSRRLIAAALLLSLVVGALTSLAAIAAAL